VFRQKAIPATLQAAISANDAQTEPTMTGANKTITFIVKGENQADIVSLADRVIKRGSIVCAD
jgi:hypothetical protein